MSLSLFAPCCRIKMSQLGWWLFRKTKERWPSTLYFFPVERDENENLKISALDSAGRQLGRKGEYPHLPDTKIVDVTWGTCTHCIFSVTSPDKSVKPCSVLHLRFANTCTTALRCPALIWKIPNYQNWPRIDLHQTNDCMCNDFGLATTFVVEQAKQGNERIDEAPQRHQ